MELKSMDVVLSNAEKYELVKRTLQEKEEELTEVERKMRALMTEDAELTYLSEFIGSEYINPEGINHSADVAPLQQQREYLGYVITKLEEKKAELEQNISGNAGAQAQPAGQASSPPPVPGSGNRNMWNS